MHVAARIAARAGPGEILVSAACLSAAGREFADRRSVELKGVTEPIDVAPIVWT